MSETQYYDADGNPVTLYKLVRIEPDWAVSRIREHAATIEAQAADLAAARERLQQAEAALRDCKRVSLPNGRSVDTHRSFDEIIDAYFAQNQEDDHAE